MALVYPSQSVLGANASNAKIKVEYDNHVLVIMTVADFSSIIVVPAIAADARKTWAAPAEDGVGWLENLKRPDTNIILYDHLEPEERQVELKDSKAPDSKIVAQRFASAEASLAEFGVDEYADRFTRVVQQYRLFSGV